MAKRSYIEKDVVMFKQYREVFSSDTERALRITALLKKGYNHFRLYDMTGRPCCLTYWKAPKWKGFQSVWDDRATPMQTIVELYMMTRDIRYCTHCNSGRVADLLVRVSYPRTQRKDGSWTYIHYPVEMCRECASSHLMGTYSGKAQMFGRS